MARRWRHGSRQILWRDWWWRALLVVLGMVVATSQVRVSRDPVSPEVAGVQVVAMGIPSDR